MSWSRFEDHRHMRHLEIHYQDNSFLHPRRTLDQFYYPALTDTSTRDADQTISKWSGTGGNQATEGKSRATGDSLLIMVDQLWCWVVDESMLPTFYPRGHAYKPVRDCHIKLSIPGYQ